MEGVESESPGLQHATDPSPPEGPARNPLEAFMTEAAQTSFVLVFPWGEWDVKSRLIVGRDFRVSPFGHQLKDYDLVSRVHAEIWVEDSELKLLHVGLHPIELNGVSLYNGEIRELKSGDTLDFAKQLIVKVKR
jgi:hypothetical protein